MRMENKGLSAKASVHVFDRKGPSLFERDIIGVLRLVRKIYFSEGEDRVSELKTKFGE